MTFREKEARPGRDERGMREKNFMVLGGGGKPFETAARTGKLLRKNKKGKGNTEKG